MVNMDFTSLEDLKIRIYPALRNRVSYFKKLGVNDITEEDIFSYFFNSWKNKKDLSLSERINYEKRGY